jgi:hypothetical protein
MASKFFEMSQYLPGTTAPPPSSTLIHHPPAYMATTMGFLLIVCCLASAHAAATAAVSAAAAGVINARSLIMAIEREGSKPSFNTLRQCNSTVQADGEALLGGRVWEDTPLFLPPKLTKRQSINQPQQQGAEKSVARGGGNG